MARWIVVGLVSAFFLATGAMADAVRTPACSRDLGKADVLLHGIRLRENSVARGDFAGLCRLLRRNLQDMAEARRLMFPCLTGHDLGENIGQIDANLGDIQNVINQRCH